MDFTNRETLHRIDAHVGKQIRQRRRARKLSQQKLAAAIGITFQQLQKYENGTNRVSAGRLYAISTVLDVPVGEWFEGLEMIKAREWMNLAK